MQNGVTSRKKPNLIIDDGTITGQFYLKDITDSILNCTIIIQTSSSFKSSLCLYCYCTAHLQEAKQNICGDKLKQYLCSESSTT